MNMYKAFGFAIHSEFPIPQLLAVPSDMPDVRIIRRDLTECRIDPDHLVINPRQMLYGNRGIADFRVSDGNLIEVDPDPNCSESHLSVFLMGSCMGAILHQRGFLPLHGSCVTDGIHSVMITGESGAGKSTLAAEFLSRGWKLLTDDVSAVYDVESVPMVRSSYPSQKLWQDALNRYERPDSDIHSLYVSESREKFGVDVTRFFHEGAAPLSLLIRLLPTDGKCSISPIEGMTKVDQLLRNTYRSFMIAPQDRQRHFQRCVTLSTKVPMALVTREKDRQCAADLYDLINDYLGGMKHD